ncbi:MAG: hypothetical protein GY737_05880 [Desulfobacteraceae bacterium]|nr:hypothetical protein [Desulfobacteraceae bacterium]
MVTSSTIDGTLTVLSGFGIEVDIDEVRKALPGSRCAKPMEEALEKSLMAARGIWCPKVVCRWLDVADITEETIRLDLPREGELVLEPGFSTRFLAGARQALVAVYTLGDELEEHGIALSAKGDYLGAYLADIIGLVALDKAGQKVRLLAEERAETLGWGVSPFLSPGSVHGWELTGQIPLCSVLPLEAIGVEIRKDAILSPFKSISCLIAVGPDYSSRTVGSTCQVCSKSDTCTMKNH